MSRIIGDRTKSALDDMMEVSKQFNEECREEARREKIRKEKEDAERKKIMTEVPSAVPMEDITLGNYSTIQFQPEPLAQMPCGLDAGPYAQITYDESLKAVKEAGYERHPYPSEVFSLIGAYFGRKAGPASTIIDLESKWQNIAQQMMRGNGEWLSMAFERNGDTLICYLDPEGLVWKEGKYVKQDFKYLWATSTDIAGKRSEIVIPLSELDNVFVKFMYGKKFKDLPERIREGSQWDSKGGICLPADGIIWPVCRNGLYIGSGYNQRESRGVRKEERAI